MYGGVVRLARVAQDGTRVRASAGVGSFRREATLQACLRAARTQVARTARPADGTTASREAAAQHRAAQERLARVDDALAHLPAIAAAKARKRSATPARASTTDPDARIMKMSDGGFRPGYNIQLATDVDARVIVGVRVITSSSDNGQVIPMLNEIERRTGRTPERWLVDGGYVNHASLDEATRRGEERPRRDGAAARRFDRGGVVARAHGAGGDEAAVQAARRDGGMGQCRRAHASHAGADRGPRADQGAHVGALGGVGSQSAPDDAPRPAPHDVTIERHGRPSARHGRIEARPPLRRSRLKRTASRFIHRL